jgi:hypothetical protein
MNELELNQDNIDDGHIVPRTHKPPQDPTGRTSVDPLVPDAIMLDEDPYITTMLCANCRAPLFKIEARVSDQGLLKSTKTTALGPWKYDKNKDECPICHGCYCKYTPNEPTKYLTSKGWV